jgi:hypothetical protein
MIKGNRDGPGGKKLLLTADRSRNKLVPLQTPFPKRTVGSFDDRGCMSHGTYGVV